MLKNYITIFSTIKYKFMTTLVELKTNNLASQLQPAVKKNLLNCVFTLLYNEYIILLYYLYYFIILKVKIKLII